MELSIRLPFQAARPPWHNPPPGPAVAGKGAVAPTALQRATPPEPEDPAATAAEPPAAQTGSNPPAPPAEAGSGSSSNHSDRPGPESQATGERSGGKGANGP